MPIAIPQQPPRDIPALKARLSRPKNDDGSPLYPEYMRESFLG